MLLCLLATQWAPCEQTASVQNRLGFPVEALPPLRPDGLNPTHPLLQAEYCAFAGAIDGYLNGGTGLHRDRAGRTRLVGNAACGRRRNERQCQDH